MDYEIFLAYDYPIENEAINYYKNEKEYITTLQTEDASNQSLVYSNMSRGSMPTRSVNLFNKTKYKDKNQTLLCKSRCDLYSPNGSTKETVDSMIDKFASQEEFIVTLKLPDESTMEAEFFEEFKKWASETWKIIEYAKRKYGQKWLDEHIPIKQMKLWFRNKSGKTVKFHLKDCELMEKVGKRDYLLYVNKMILEQNG